MPISQAISLKPVVTLAFRYFGIPRSLFYVWRNTYRKFGEGGRKRKKPIPRTHPNQTPDEIVEKILYLR